MFNLYKQKKGYTLLEILLSVAIISVIAGFSISVYQTFQNRNDLDVTVGAMMDSLRRAHFFSQGIKNDSQWGVKIENSKIVLFQGNSFSTRDQSYDEEFLVSSTISSSGLQEIVFEKFSGTPDSVGLITLTSINNDSRSISINSKGFLDY
ncbi:MAG: prepilin-type N-terminal cleavage/methylation domain-containing protein [Candidatus Moranbacteria bacterium]|nr:prepilin-type N-terminal cleavage/methylation domain-containing protein [Candidatus Moranbacteria bacterium]